MVEQRGLTALERLDQKGSAQIVQIAIRLGTEGLLKRASFGEPRVDLVGIHMLAEHNADAFDPVQRADGPSMSSAIRNEKFAAHQ